MVSNELDKHSCDALISSIEGKTLFQDSTGFEEARTSVWNLDTLGMPIVIVRCKSVHDVTRTIEFARQKELSICVRTAGGHSSHAVVDGCVVIDLSLLRSVHVDPAARTVTIQGGATIGDVDSACKPHGLVLPMGHAHHLGVAGMVLTGTSGVGYLSRTRLLTAHHLRSATLVTCEGEVVRTSEEENPQLLWGVRGAGANFGVVVEMVFSLGVVAPQLFAGDVVKFGKGTGPGYAFGFIDCKESREQLALRFFEFFGSAPDECSALCVLAPKGPVVFRIVYCPKEEHSQKPISEIATEAKAAFAPLTSYGTKTAWNGAKMMDFWDGVQKLGMFNPSYYYTRSANISDIPPSRLSEIVRRLCSFAESCPVTHKSTGIIIQPLGGKLSKMDPRSIPTAEVFKVQMWSVNILVEFPKGAQDASLRERCVQWVNDVYQVVEEFAVRDEGRTKDCWTETLGDIYGNNVAPLKELKKKYDPENVFRFNRNVLPR